MLAKPNISAVLRQYPNLRLIGWLGSEEKLSDPAVSSLAASGMVTTGNPDQLVGVIRAFCNIFRQPGACNDAEIAKPDAAIDPADYRLCDEELDALLGAG